jgi:hypothetical protein
VRAIEEIVALLNQGTMIMKWFYRIAIAVGCGFLGLSVALYIVLDRAAAAEQAVSPGEDSFGVAVLAMMYGPSILATAAGGLLSLFLGMSVLTFQRLRNPN